MSTKFKYLHPKKGNVLHLEGCYPAHKTIAIRCPNDFEDRGEGEQTHSPFRGESDQKVRARIVLFITG